MVRKASKRALSREAWALMFGFLMGSGAQRSHSLAQRGLTPNEARALWALAEREGRPIGDLAREWECDPANATFIIGRLTRCGLVERRPSEADRRVKLVRLTPAGARVKQELMDEYLQPPDAFGALSERDLEGLINGLKKLQRAGDRGTLSDSAGNVSAAASGGAKPRR